MALAAPPPGFAPAEIKLPFADDPDVRAVMVALGEARFVGGAVRDAILGRPVTDIDVATPLEPAAVAAALRAAGLRAVPTGIAHGTLTALSGARSIEVTTLRRDVSTDGRWATIAFTTDWLEDAARRDFTMNALYVDGACKLYDPMRGYRDLVARRVRFIGDARTRIAEDYLRILRFFRFNAWYGDGQFDDMGLSACADGQGGLVYLSAERVRGELLKLLAAPDPRASLAAMAETGILGRLMPPPHRIEAVEALVLAEHIAGVCDPLRRLAALGAPADSLAERLRLSNAERDRIAAIQAVAALTDADGAALDRLAYRHGAIAVIDRLFLDRPRDWRREARRLAAFVAPDFPLKGEDALKLGLSGREVGLALKRLEARWVDGNFAMSREDLLRGLAAETGAQPRPGDAQPPIAP